MSDTKGAVRVIVRVRPFLSKEKSDQRCLWVDTASSSCESDEEWIASDDEQESEAFPTRKIKLREELESVSGVKSFNEYNYDFDASYGEEISQQSLFKLEVHPAISRLLQGYNTTIFCYGVTCSGKTYTIEGSESAQGIIPRAVRRLLALRQEMRQKAPSKSMKISMSYMEIYNEKVQDLLQPSTKDLPLRETPQGKILVSGLHLEPIETYNEFYEHYMRGRRQRATGSTDLNLHSSRSHSILSIYVKYRESASPYRLIDSKLNMIDLAGSEDNRVTGNRGTRLTESSSINRSLFVLGNVINALNAGHKRIPYRDSKITRLLQDCLGGSNFALMICNLAPCKKYYLHTFNTLNFGRKARNIVNRVVPTVIEAPEAPREQAQKTQKPEKSTRTSATFRGKTSGGGVGLPRRKKSISSIVDQTPKRKKVKMTKEVKKTAKETELRDQTADCIITLGKQKLAKELILQAKDLKSEGKEKEALTLYEGAAELIPDNRKLAQKIEQLKLKIYGKQKESQSSKEKENLNRLNSGREEIEALLTPFQRDKGTVRKKISLTKIPVPISEGEPMLEKEAVNVVHILNHGSEKELLSYSKIGKATAQQIVRARQKSTFTCIKDLQLIGKSSKWIEQFIQQNSLS